MRIRNTGAWLRRQWRGIIRWTGSHPVVLTGLGLIACQLGWTAYLLTRSYFRQTDFLLLDRALREGFGWKYLMWPNSGHLMPAGLAVTWALARTSLYNWPAASVVVILLTAAASLAMLRMLLTVFARPAGGITPGVLFPLAIYLFLPLSVSALSWLSVGLRILPFQVAMFLAVDAHVRYLRSRRNRHLIAAAVWLLAGMASADQGALVPFLLFALTVAYFEPGQWRDVARQAATRYWRAWLLYGALLAAYCAVFFLQLHSYGVNVPGPGKTISLYQFAGTVFGTGLLPAMAGGPWEWAVSGYAQAGPPVAAEYLSWVVAGIVVVASCFYRTTAWRAWAILLGWVLAACVLPVALGGFALPVTEVGAQTGYLANATGVLALSAGLAFLPVGEAPAAAPRALRLVGVLAFCCFAAGVAASLPDFVAATSAAATRSYVANARAALAQAPRGTLVVDGPTPATIMASSFFPGQADTAVVLGSLARNPRSARLSWVTALNGVYPGGGPMTFDTDGVLRPVTVTGVRSLPAPRPARACWSATTTGVSVPLEGTLYPWPWTLRLAYSGPAGVLTVTFGDGAQTILVPAGSHVAYLAVTGSGDAVDVLFTAASGDPLCVTGITVGLVNPDQAGPGIPASPAAGLFQVRDSFLHFDLVAGRLTSRKLPFG
jgi:hypothetical protein